MLFFQQLTAFRWILLISLLVCVLLFCLLFLLFCCELLFFCCLWWCCFWYVLCVFSSFQRHKQRRPKVDKSSFIAATMASSSKASGTQPKPPLGILDRSLIKPAGVAKAEVSLSSFALLFSEIVQYNQNRVDSISDLERK